MVTLQFYSIEELLKFKLMFALAGSYDLEEMTLTTTLSEVEIDTAKKRFGAKLINGISKGDSDHFIDLNKTNQEDQVD